MNSVHDMGGMHGFGKVIAEPDEPVFHADWEGRVLAIMRAILFSRAWNIDVFRHSQERLPAHVYLSVSYYERWLLGITKNALEYGLVEAAELDAGHALVAPKLVERTMKAANLSAATARAPYGRPSAHEPRFQAGDRVSTVNLHPLGHTRLPRYARNKLGTVQAIRGCHVYPDAKAAGQGDDPQWLYTVVFEARELWGPEADATLTVSIDAFEPYLQEA